MTVVTLAALREKLHGAPNDAEVALVIGEDEFDLRDVEVDLPSGEIRLIADD